jgi:hypothetical protein
MCDFISWIEVGSGKTLKRYWLEDDMIQAKWPDAPMFDEIGHSAIKEYYGVDGKHWESTKRVPIEIAKRVNAGKMREMAKAGGVSTTPRFSLLTGRALADVEGNRIKREEKKKYKALFKKNLKFCKEGAYVVLGAHERFFVHVRIGILT